MTEPTPYATPAAPAGPRTNTLAIVALILGFVAAPAGIVVGFIALSQIKKTGEAGHGLAIGGIIVGIVLTLLWLLIVGFSIIFPLILAGSLSSYSY